MYCGLARGAPADSAILVYCSKDIKAHGLGGGLEDIYLTLDCFLESRSGIISLYML